MNQVELKDVLICPFCGMLNYIHWHEFKFVRCVNCHEAFQARSVKI